MTSGTVNLAPLLPVGLLLPILAILLGLVLGQVIRHRSTPVARTWLLRLGMLLLVIVMAFRPAIGGSAPASTAEGGLEVYFVVDTTSSMAAEDYGTNSVRLDGVKTDIAALAQSLQGAEFSLVTFDSSAVQRMPLTTDLGALRSAVTVMTQEVTGYSAGSNIDASLDLMTGILSDATEDKPDRPRILYYFGDGEQTSPESPRSFAPLAALVDGGGVLGYGTAEGGQMMSFDGFDDEQSAPAYIIDYSTTPPSFALSRIDEAALGGIASQIGVQYSHRVAGESIDPLVAGIQVADPTVESTSAGAPFEFYWLVAIPLALLLVREVMATFGALAESRQGSPSRTPRRRRTARPARAEKS
jgi:Ca-activated chloride channel family protein